MAGIVARSFDHPDERAEFEHGRSAGVTVGTEVIWRSELGPGWSWDDDIKPLTGGLEACPLYHREYVVSGRIRYRMLDGTEVVGEAGQFLYIEPGHRAWVVGSEPAVLIDW